MNDTMNSNWFYQEFVSPLYKKYEDNPHFTIETNKGEKFWNIQYALLNEPDVFTPITNPEDKIIGFYVKDYPEYIMVDSQYGEDLPIIMFEFVMKHYVKTGETTQIIGYVGFGDVSLKELAC